uniref:Uncharacterized protein n=1 Tax=Photinus pyralis TaxID=7054 RepID=A0A1Y1LFK0_PHOPY
MFAFLQQLFVKKNCRLDAGRKPPIPSTTNSSSFLMKVLLALVSFQNDPCFSDGATADDIITYLQKTYVVDGDLHGQVQAAIRTGVTVGCISAEQDSKYIAIPFTAAVQETSPNSRKRKRAVRKTKRIFSREVYDGDTSSSGGTSDCSSVKSVCKSKRRCRKRKRQKSRMSCNREGEMEQCSLGTNRMRTRNYKS